MGITKSQVFNEKLKRFRDLEQERALINYKEVSKKLESIQIALSHKIQKEPE